MDKQKIYNLLCKVIKEAELGKKECLRDDFEMWRLCDHAWENIENLVEEIGKTITAEHRAIIDDCRTDVDFINRDAEKDRIEGLLKSYNLRGISGV